MMDRIIAAAENDRAYYRPMTDAARPEPAATIPDAICASMRQVTSLLPIAAIVTYTTSGSSSLRMSPRATSGADPQHGDQHRNGSAIDAGLGRPLRAGARIGSVDEMSAYAGDTARREGFAAEGDTIVVAAGTPIGVPGTTNMLKILNA